MDRSGHADWVAVLPEPHSGAAPSETATAHAVARLLFQRGDRRSQVETVGLGSYFDGYVVVHNPEGSPIPATAAQNRTVVEVTHR